MPEQRATQALEAVRSAIKHFEMFAQDSPLERFLAQEIARAKSEAFAEAGWYQAAKEWSRAVAVLGEREIETRLRLK